MEDQPRSIEAAGETIEAAVAIGLTELGLTRDQVDIQVVREPRSGVLGIGARDALVQLTEIKAARPASLEAPQAEAEPEEDIEPELQPETGAELEPDLKAEREALLKLAHDTLAEMLDKMQIEARIQARVAEPRFAGDSYSLVLDLRGDDLGFLIGRQGETLAAIQHLLRLMVNKVAHHTVHLTVDVEGYKLRRETALKKLALRMAEQATRRGRRVALEPMSPYERRIIHVALRNHPTVTTESVGEGERRKVTILPRS